MRRATLLMCALAMNAACGGDGREVRTGLTLAEAMGSGDTLGYLRALGPRAFEFPADHGAHPGFRVEWWYLTGNLTTTDGRRFGFQLTFFRSAQTASPPERSSAWATDAVWMAHFALTDAGEDRFRAYERFARDAADLAGARAAPFRVHVEDWSVASADSAATFPLRVHAATDEVSLDLTLALGKPIVLQGDSGLSAKGPEPGNASFYYSLTRMPARGSVRIGDARYDVAGAAWMDREWSTSALGDDLAGWDWFALQLDDGTDLMLYQLRRTDGTASPFSAGTLVAPDGSTTRLGSDDFTLEPDGTWRSTVDRAAYPAAWRVRVPENRLDLVVTPVLPDQELDLTVRYWEGAVDVSGNRSGRGYLEMTGYATSSGDAAAAAPVRGGR